MSLWTVPHDLTSIEIVKSDKFSTLDSFCCCTERSKCNDGLVIPQGEIYCQHIMECARKVSLQQGKKVHSRIFNYNVWAPKCEVGWLQAQMEFFPPFSLSRKGPQVLVVIAWQHLASCFPPFYQLFSFLLSQGAENKMLPNAPARGSFCFCTRCVQTAEEWGSCTFKS